MTRQLMTRLAAAALPLCALVGAASPAASQINPAHTPSPAPASAAAPLPVGAIPAALREYSNYGIWDFKVEELGPAVDGEWQAVVKVRDSARYRVGVSMGGVMMVLFDEDGRGLSSNDVIYRASVTGSAQQLEAIPQTLWMEKGDEVRVRIRIPDTKGFKPVRVRLYSGDRETLSRTFPMQ